VFNADRFRHQPGYEVAWRLARGRIAALRERAEAAGIPLGRPSTESAVAELERDLGVPLSLDYRAWLESSGGEGGAQPWRGLWRVSEVAGLNRSLPAFQWFGGLIGFGNEGFMVHAFDYRKGYPPPVVSFGLSSSEWADLAPGAETFEAWVRASL
jgi:hypothetical protein